jgi:hypothetical protein
MRLVMTLLVRDEEELLPVNLDYHLRRGVDFVLVTDHGSTDATPEILEEYVSRGVARVLRVEDEAYDQSKWVTRMARLAAVEHGADWVINNDADEFWWPLAGTLPDMLALVPARYGQLPCPRHNFLPQPGGGPFWECMVVREARSQNLIGGDLEPGVAHRAHPEVVVDFGNHWLRGIDLPQAPALPLIEVFHFPIRSFEQFEHKVVQAGRALQALHERPSEVGRDALTLYDIHARGELRNWFDETMLGAERIETRVASGELIVDRRLERFLAAGEAPDSAAGRVAASRLAAEAFALADRAEGLESQLAELRDSLAARDQALADTQRMLESVSAELQTLRDSKLVRWTAPARNLYYRARGRLR